MAQRQRLPLWKKIRKPLAKAINQALSSHLPHSFPGLEVGWEPSTDALGNLWSQDHDLRPQ